MSTTEAISGKAPPRIEALVRRINDISSLPHVAMRVIEVANDPKSNAADLKHVIEGDASLSARILRCVNSSAYATRSKITNLQLAIAYLGMKGVRNLALAGSVSSLFKNNETIGTYQRSKLWKHLVSVGICARLIAMRRRFDNFEDVFLAGLLHDIGLVLEDQYANEPFCHVMRSLSPSQTLVASEMQYLGFAHTVLGALVAEAWKFPEPITAAIQYHHKSENYRGDSIDTVRCVEVANLLCTLKGISSVGMKLLEVSPSAMQGLSLTKEDVSVLLTDLDREIEMQAILFQL